jgi:hypothetical protein
MPLVLSHCYVNAVASTGCMLKFTTFLLLLLLLLLQ